jgi:hypothetical protein
MAEPRSDNLLRSRQEAALLLRLDPQNLSASDALRCDLIATLRLSIDSAQADALEGRAADLGRLIVATESLVKLLPSEPPKPASSSPSPQEIMWRTYKQMRDRGADVGQGYDGKVKQVEALQSEVEQLKGEIEQLKAQLAGSVPLPDNVVKMSLRNDIPSPSAPASAAPAAPPEPAPPQYQLVPADEPWRPYSHLFE